MSQNTKIVATIGPASNKEVLFGKLVSAGVDVVRLNFSHGTHADHQALIKMVRKVSKKLAKPVAVLQDLQGPRIRVSNLVNPVPVKANQKIVLAAKEIAQPGMIPVDYAGLATDVKARVLILIADGRVELEVVSVRKGLINCRVVTPGLIETHKGINVPEVVLKVDVITAKDKSDLNFGLEQQVDWVALSFVKTAEDIKRLRRLIVKKRPQGLFPGIIAKIEHREAIKNIRSIIEVADGLMIARGDLGLECLAEEVPFLQKKMIALGKEFSKPVIVATQMLDSMISNPRPTRAEVQDVATAVWEGSDCVMLSGETANGKYPLKTVSLMSRVIKLSEDSHWSDYDTSKVNNPIASLASELKVETVIFMAEAYDYLADVVSSRLRSKVVLVTNDQALARRVSLFFGVSSSSGQKLTGKALLSHLLKKKVIKSKEKVLLVRGGGQKGECHLDVLIA